VNPHGSGNYWVCKRVAARGALTPSQQRFNALLLLFALFACAATLVLTKTFFVEVAFVVPGQFFSANAAEILLRPVDSFVHFANLE
jgi:hypothetical protein